MKRHAFTLIELLVVVAIIALLISILLPSLQAAKEEARKGVCLSNLKNIGNATQMYAAEDERGLVIPIQQKMVTPTAFSEWPEHQPSYWLHRTAIWFSYGGRSCPDTIDLFNGEVRLGDDSPYAARHRPLNRLMYPTDLQANFDGGVDTKTGAAYDLPAFQCPADVGYPDSPDVDDAPRASAEKPCYDIYGNSYRASLFSVLRGSGSNYWGAFAYGPWGKSAERLRNTGRIILIGEAQFFNMIGRDDGQSGQKDAILLNGWHGKKMRDNLLFVDGSARTTMATGAGSVGDRPDIAPSFRGVPTRGADWQFDCYPTPGTHIWGRLARPEYFTSDADRTLWPYRGYNSIETDPLY